MKIVHVITRFIQGGAQQNTLLSASWQQRQGHELCIAHGPIYGPEGSLADEADRAGVQRVELAHMRRAVLPYHDAMARRELGRLLRERKPDLVHTHSSKAGVLGRAAAWAERERRARRGEGRPIVVHTIHGLPFHDHQPRLTRGAYVALERWAARRCDQLVAITPAMREAFEKEGIVRSGVPPIEVIPSGVDVSRLSPERLDREAARRRFGLEASGSVVGIVARLDPLKGHRDLFSAVSSLRRSGRAVQVLVVGDGWDRRSLERAASSWGLSDVVRWTGLLPHEQVYEALSAMDVKVLPSYQEGQSRTLIEALLAGCGIVAYNVGGMPAICEDGRTGRLTPAGDVSALAEAIAWMLDHPQARQAMVEAGRARVIERFSADAMCRQLDRLYEAWLT